MQVIGYLSMLIISEESVIMRLNCDSQTWALSQYKDHLSDHGDSCYKDHGHEPSLSLRYVFLYW